MQEYVPAIVVAFVTVMLMTVVLLAALLESLGRRYRVSHVVALMAGTSVITACIVSLCGLFLAYRPLVRNPDYRGSDGASASRSASPTDEGSRRPVLRQVDTDGSQACPFALSNRSLPHAFDGKETESNRMSREGRR